MSSSKSTINQFHHRSLSPHPTRITTRSTSPTVRLTPLASTTTTKADNIGQTVSHKTYSLNNNDCGKKKKTCSCSPTRHPGSYRCSLHKGNKLNNQKNFFSSLSSCRPNYQLNMRRSAMTNSLVRIGAVEGEFVKRALAAMILRSLRRRFDFQPTKSRLSVMSKAKEGIEEEAELSRIVKPGF